MRELMGIYNWMLLLQGHGRGREVSMKVRLQLIMAQQNLFFLEINI